MQDAIGSTATPSPPLQKVWDLPTRLFHWALVICFAGAWLTAENEGQELLHLLFGYSLFGLILFRLVWGFVGSRYARFGSFAFGPRTTLAYLRSMFRRTPTHYIGHNPVGAVAVWLLLALGLATAVTGWMMATGRAGESLEEVHETISNAMLVLVGLHIVGVVVSSLLHRENLPRAMVTGRKRLADAGDGITRDSTLVAAGLLAALLAFWGVSMRDNAVPFGLGAGMEREAGEHARGEAAGEADEGHETRGERERDDD